MSNAASISSYNDTFERYVRHFKSHLKDLSLEDKTRANKWMETIKRCNSSIHDLILRNDVMLRLLMQMRSRYLIAPFDTDPTSRNLPNLPPITLTADNVLPEPFKLPQALRQSPDQGVLIVPQPIPHCGAYCYLAVVSRPTSN